MMNTIRVRLVFVLLRSRFASHEGLYLFECERAVFIGIHRLEDFLVSGLEFLQRNGSITIAIHQSEDEAHGDASAHHAIAMHHAAVAHHATAHHASLPHHGVTLTMKTGAFLGNGSQRAACQNKRTRDDHQNMLLHGIPPFYSPWLGAPAVVAKR
jgi:hypothetical protein